MSIYNTLVTEARCPYCGASCEVRADFRFGLREQRDYRLGDRLQWEGKGVRTPTHRPPEGNFVGEAFTECPSCGREYWLLIAVESDVIASAATDMDREDYADP
jgi:hypothetical protein